MPGLTITTGGTPVAGATGAGAGSHANPPPPNPQPPAAGRRGSRAASPSRPPVSPITPTLGPTQLAGGPPPASQIPPLPGANNSNNNNIPSFAQGRPVFTHSQPDQVGISQLPPAQPISFDDNPDVLALKSAISILQLQRARAQADMQALNRAKEAALADPGAFIADLTEGRVSMEGDPLFSGLPRRDQPQEPEENDESSSSSSSDENEDDEKDAQNPSDPKSKSQTKTSPSSRKKGKLKAEDNKPPKKPWRTLPKAQTVVRMPPINWAQYGVVGESLDKLHAEQIAAPTSGTPVPLGPGGVFQFKAATEQMLRDEQASSHQIPQRLPGIAAPYTPGKDKLVQGDTNKGVKGATTEKKGRAGKR
ncbi:hypothetical protein V8F20_009914 [Naviculisporaceae sp. PSN 640]